MKSIGSLEVRWVQGFTNQRVAFVDSSTVCYPCGNHVIFIDLETKKQRVLQSPGGSIGAFTVNARTRMVAFSEQRLNPSIYVYTFPQFGKQSELKGKAQLEYTTLAFSNSGPYLASYSSVPDYTLTIWNWQDGVPLCSQAQPGVEVTRLMFNPMNWHQLCMTSERSLKVWNIERSDTLHCMKPIMISMPALEPAVPQTEDVSSSHLGSKLSYYGPPMPISAISGLVGEMAETFVPKEAMKKQLHPTSFCWTSTTDLYVGCEEGHLMLVSSETGKVTVLHNLCEKYSPGDSPHVLQQGILDSLALHKDGLYAAGIDGILRRIHIKGMNVEVDICCALEEPIRNIGFSPNFESLVLASHKGAIYRYSPSQPGKVSRILDVRSGNFVAAAPLSPGNQYCVSVRESGEVQVWSLEDGDCTSALSLKVQATCLACCPSARCSAVGTASGHVYFIDLTKVEQPRVVHRVHLYHAPLEQLHFDQGGQYLLTGATDKHIFILDARPSKMFAVFGYTVAAGFVLGLSTVFNKDNRHVKVLALVTLEEAANIKEGTRLEMFTLPHQLFTGTLGSHTNNRGVLNDDILQKRLFEVAQPLSSAVLGTNNRVYGYCNRSKSIQKFILAEGDMKGVSHVNPEKEVEGHQLGPASLILSPHQQWLASVSKDGLLRIRDISSLGSYVQVQCHSYRTDGVQSMSFSVDSQAMLTTGFSDGALVCVKWRVDTAGKMNAAIEYGQSVMSQLETSVMLGNVSLMEMSEWKSAKDTPPSSAVEKEAQEASQKKNVEVTEDHSYTILPLVSLVDATWLDEKLDEAIKEESLEFTDTKKSLRKGIKELRRAIQAMMRENESLPEIEKLEQQEFNLDVEEQKRLQVEGEQEIARICNEIELENLAKCYLRDVLKKECWDSMEVKGRAIKAFCSEYEVKNYPMKERTQKETEELVRISCLRKIEMADLQIRKEITEFQTKAQSDKDEEEIEEEGANELENPALTGSLSAQYDGCNPYLYSQFSLHTKEEKINQIILLQDVIHSVKLAFNKEFESVFKQKEQEINRVKDKNQRLQEIMTELDLKEKLWEPELCDNEKPERTLTVDDSEIKVEKYLTPEQKRKAEELAKIEEQRRQAAKGDNARERALDDMMGGVLEVKKEDILKMEIPQPEFMSKPEAQWLEDEKKQFKEYEKKVKELNEEREKYRKTLEAEMKKLQTSIKDSTQVFDETLSRLFERKVKSEMVIYQEELKIANLVFSIVIEEELVNRETELNHLLDKTRKMKHASAEELKNCKAQVDAFRETYDNIVAEDKLLDRGFRKEFFDVPTSMVDQLYKLYKRRPRVQRMRTQIDTVGPADQPGSVQATREALFPLMKAMDELDDPQSMPEGLDPSIWQRFCLSRRTKVESEQMVKQKALTLAEMQAFLQKRTEEDEKHKRDIEKIIDDLNGLREEKMRFQLDLIVQFLLKQGSVEVDGSNFIADYSDALLLHRGAVEDLNGTIRTLGEQKIASMVESKDFRKGIIQQEWEHMRMRMQMEDLNNKARDIQMLKVSRELQVYLNETDHESCSAKQMSVLEQTLAAQKKNHKKNVKNAKRIIKGLERQIAHKDKENDSLDKELQELLVTVSERRHVYGAIAVEDNTAINTEKRYQDIIERRKLVDLARTQAQEVAILRAEVERLRMKTFPALVQIGH
ncbi:cilia- and flagella-associated protein 43 isoform X1 [Acipenser oxyrinchus oxyrinchus]|uniref:Cilia- and flagella-associated protein 43 n=1 Tax=Acipenser oxyrinchus oxyrinchus TaxID=40147 RepID=A0AAD8G622_ACIOX|nr:cilia- and flagella-associated protein 43 isoform X1 [Acipenser oxyrinchus oxyrinchus]